MQLYFIRHGQSANNALWDNTGASKGRSEDPELTEVGRRQAVSLAEYLSHNGNRFGITHLYTSLMVRSVETAITVGQSLNLPVHAWEDIHESGGIYQEQDEGDPIGLPGKTREHFTSSYPALVLPESLYENGWWNRPYEPLEAVTVRAQRFLSELLARHGDTDDIVAIVSHGNFYRYFLSVALRLPDPQAVWFLMNNTALSRIDFLPALKGMVVIQFQNRIDHLPAELVT